MSGATIVKMSGAGNDFIVLGPEAASMLDRPAPDWIRSICRRRMSVGADGVLFVEPAGPGRVRVRFHNPDGSEAFCGNGSRCAARFAYLRDLAGRRMVLETSAGEVPAEVLDSSAVRLELPAPRDQGRVALELGDETLRGRVVRAGNPHLVVEVESCAGAPLGRWGPAARRHPQFGAGGANVNLIERTGRESIVLRTWERGVEGETLACGSGAVAAALAVRLDGGPERLRVTPASGCDLIVELPGPQRSPSGAVLSGDARLIFEGQLGPDGLWADSSG